MGYTYVLPIFLNNKKSIEVGALGDIEFDSGWYGYVGSDHRNNYSRPIRHLNLSESKDTQHWHVDYLLSDSNTEVFGVYIIEDGEECSVSENIELESISMFGCSDCTCESHLYYSLNIIEFTKSIVKSINKYKYRWCNSDKLI